MLAQLETDHIVELRKEGKTSREIKKVTGHGRTTILKVMQNVGLNQRLDEYDLTDEQKALIKTLREQDVSILQIHKRFNISRPKISKYCREIGVEPILTLRAIEGKRKGAQTQTKNRVWLTCLNCDNQYQTKRTDGSGLIFCSRICAFEWKHKWKEYWPSCSVYFNICEACGQLFTSQHGLEKRCSRECRLEFGKQRWEQFYKENHLRLVENERKRNGVILKKKKCEECNEGFEVYEQSQLNKLKFCSIKCGDRFTKRLGRHRRRCRKSQTIVERFNDKEVFMRDGWRCKICGGKVKKNDKVPHPMAATLDHIVPLNKGGTHEKRNVQLAHFICNSMKSDGVGVNDQLRIF